MAFKVNDIDDNSGVLLEQPELDTRGYLHHYTSNISQILVYQSSGSAVLVSPIIALLL